MFLNLHNIHCEPLIFTNIPSVFFFFFESALFYQNYILRPQIFKNLEFTKLRLMDTNVEKSSLNISSYQLKIRIFVNYPWKNLNFTCFFAQYKSSCDHSTNFCDKEATSDQVYRLLFHYACIVVRFMKSGKFTHYLSKHDFKIRIN